MRERFPQIAQDIMNERFGHDSLIALATVDGTMPWVRTVNSYYEDGYFYTITHALSNKIKQIERNPSIAISGDWFTAHGHGENLGWIREAENEALAAKLRAAFSEWYNNGHTNEDDPNTIILRIRLTNGTLFSHGIRYDIDFTNESL